MSKTKIEWADRVWNPVTGCTKVSTGCANCYAEGVAKRFWGSRKFGDVICHDDRLVQPLRWRKPQRIFVNSMSDLFHPDVPDLFIADVFEQMWRCHNHTFMVLTKRPERMYRWPVERKSGPIPNVWLGVSVEDQATANERIPFLLQTPAAVRFVSCEPMLGPINFRWRPYFHQATGETYREYLHRKGSINHLESMEGIDWVICGGESGPKARPMHPDWAKALRDQCVAAGVPFFFKQWGEWAPASQVVDNKISNITHAITPGGVVAPFVREAMIEAAPSVMEWEGLRRLGKKTAGNTLDGERWEQFPGDLP